MSDLYPKPHVGVSDPHGNIHKLDPMGSSRDYPDIPADSEESPPAKPAAPDASKLPGLCGGPATEAVPGCHETTPWEPLKEQADRSATTRNHARRDDRDD